MRFAAVARLGTLLAAVAKTTSACIALEDGQYVRLQSNPAIFRVGRHPSSSSSRSGVICLVAIASWDECVADGPACSRDTRVVSGECWPVPRLRAPPPAPISSYTPGALVFSGYIELQFIWIPNGSGVALVEMKLNISVCINIGTTYYVFCWFGSTSVT